MKASRHRLIMRILGERAVASQTELASLLRARGERVTQATLSRDLDELGAFKTRLPDGSVAYRVPEEPPGSGDHLARMLTEFVTSIDTSGTLVVLRTPPGCAQAVARAIDTTGIPGLLATIAGDDTVLCVCREGVSGKIVARRIGAIMERPKTAKEARR